MKKIKELSKYERYKLFGLIVDAITGVVGGSLVLQEGHPYITLGVLATGAAANKTVSFYKERELNTQNNEK
jgi:hypothetical protein